MTSDLPELLVYLGNETGNFAKQHRHCTGKWGDIQRGQDERELQHLGLPEEAWF